MHICLSILPTCIHLPIYLPTTHLPPYLPTCLLETALLGEYSCCLQVQPAGRIKCEHLIAFLISSTPPACCYTPAASTTLHLLPIRSGLGMCLCPLWEFQENQKLKSKALRFPFVSQPPCQSALLGAWKLRECPPISHWSNNAAHINMSVRLKQLVVTSVSN